MFMHYLKYMHGEEEKNHLTNEHNNLCYAHFSTQLNAK